MTKEELEAEIDAGLEARLPAIIQMQDECKKRLKRFGQVLGTHKNLPQDGEEVDADLDVAPADHKKENLTRLMRGWEKKTDEVVDDETLEVIAPAVYGYVRDESAMDILKGLRADTKVHVYESPEGHGWWIEVTYKWKGSKRTRSLDMGHRPELTTEWRDVAPEELVA